jgi:hypothetical protein
MEARLETMQKVKLTLTIALAGMLLTISLSVLYLELFLIPDLLGRQQLAIVVHVLGILFIIIASNRLGAWFEKRSIYAVQKELITNHLSALTGAITNVVVGRWNVDADIQKSVFNTGARLGFNIRDEVEIDRGQILENIGAMNLPSPRRAAGQTTDVVEDMDNYLNSLDARKQRLGNG